MANHSSNTLKSRRDNTWWWIVLASVLLHLVVIGLTHQALGDFRDAVSRESKTVTMRIKLPDPEIEEDPIEVPEVDGQIVDIAEADEPERPDEADYLAEYDQVAEDETRTEQVRVNPEILDHEYSEEDELKFEDLTDVNAIDPSTGAQVGNNRFDPDEDGALASLPSRFKVTNRDGLQRPVPSSHAQSAYSGAPNNDLLDLEAARKLALNTQKIQFAGYLNRIRRLVNFYWSQNVKNMPNSVRATLRRPTYQTSVFVVLSDDGVLESLELIKGSGSRHMDLAAERAFHLAGPFPHPPAEMLAPDGRVYLPDFEFTVTVGAGGGSARVIDARAGVQFPGLLKGTP
jgi:hypothetical protein